MDEGDANRLNNDDNNCSSCIKHGYWFIAVGLCFLVELIAIICTFSYKNKYDESDSDLAQVSGILLIVGLVGQTAGFCGVNVIAEKAIECGENCKDEHGNNVCLVYLLVVTIPVFGLLQFIAALLMMVNNTENDAANVKVFGAFIIIMDIIAAALSVVYGAVVLPWTFCCQDNRKENAAL